MSQDLKIIASGDFISSLVPQGNSTAPAGKGPEETPVQVFSASIDQSMMCAATNQKLDLRFRSETDGGWSLGFGHNTVLREFSTDPSLLQTRNRDILHDLQVVSYATFPSISFLPPSEICVIFCAHTVCPYSQALSFFTIANSETCDRMALSLVAAKVSI